MPMIQMLDYIFYRIYNHFDKRRDSTPVLKGCIALSLLLLFSILSIIAIFSLFFRQEFKINRLFGGGVFLIAMLFFWMRFKNNELINILKEKYDNEDFNKKRRNAAYITLYFLVIFLLPIIYGVFKHNFKMDI